MEGGRYFSRVLQLSLPPSTRGKGGFPCGGRKGKLKYPRKIPPSLHKRWFAGVEGAKEATLLVVSPCGGREGKLKYPRSKEENQSLCTPSYPTTFKRDLQQESGSEIKWLVYYNFYNLKIILCTLLLMMLTFTGLETL